MICALSREEILALLIRQLGNFFPVDDREQRILAAVFPATLARCEHCFLSVPNKYFQRQGQAYFSPFHSVQWLTFLCYLAHTVSMKETDGDFDVPVCKQLADKVYYLNKIMNSVDIYHEVQLPGVMSFEHPLGTVIGRAKLSDGLFVYQGCTIGGNIKDGRLDYPVIGKNFRMYSNSKILGRCTVGDNVTLAANTYVINADIASDSIVFGQSPNLIIKRKK